VAWGDHIEHLTNMNGFENIQENNLKKKGYRIKFRVSFPKEQELK